MTPFCSPKTLCPICAKPALRLLAGKIAGFALCRDCESKIDLPNELAGRLTLEN